MPRETYNSRLWSGSLEIGYASPVLRAPGSDWSLVPMVQAVYNDFTMGDLRESTGTVIRHRDCSRFLIRSGLRLEGRPNDESRLPAEPYLEANRLHKTRA